MRLEALCCIRVAQRIMWHAQGLAFTCVAQGLVRWKLHWQACNEFCSVLSRNACPWRQPAVHSGAQAQAPRVQESEFKSANRIFFLSVPPGVFVDAARGASGAASSECASHTTASSPLPLHAALCHCTQPSYTTPSLRPGQLRQLLHSMRLCGESSQRLCETNPQHSLAHGPELLCEGGIACMQLHALQFT
jgi:hypothetical protein